MHKDAIKQKRGRGVIRVGYEVSDIAEKIHINRINQNVKKSMIKLTLPS